MRYGICHRQVNRPAAGGPSIGRTAAGPGRSSKLESHVMKETLMQWQTSGRGTGRRDMSSGASCSVGSILGSAIGSWVCGALSGASLMYFFDPDRGARRRESLLAAGEGAWDAARDS